MCYNMVKLLIISIVLISVTKSDPVSFVIILIVFVLILLLLLFCYNC